MDLHPASNWLNSDVLNLQKIRDSQQADPVLSTVYDWVDRGVHPALSTFSAEGKAIKYCKPGNICEKFIWRVWQAQ